MFAPQHPIRPQSPVHRALPVLVGLPLVLAMGCATKDIRPDNARGAISADDTARGRALLAAMNEAHGLEAHKATAAVRATVHDDWSMAPFPLSFAKPFANDPQSYIMEVKPGTNDTKLTFTDGELAKTQWGLTDGKPFTAEADGEPAYKEDDTIRRSVGALGFFFLSPFTLQDATVVYALGTENLNGKTYEKVFVSWGTAEPQDDVDQYIAWIDADTKHLAYLEHTLRAFLKSRSGVMAFEDHKDVGGVVYPHTITSVDGVGGPAKIHRMSIERIERIEAVN